MDYGEKQRLNSIKKYFTKIQIVNILRYTQVTDHLYVCISLLNEIAIVYLKKITFIKNIVSRFMGFLIMASH